MKKTKSKHNMTTSKQNTTNSLSIITELNEKLMNWQPSKKQLLASAQAQADQITKEQQKEYYVQLSRMEIMIKEIKQRLGTRVLSELEDDKIEVLGAEMTWQNPQRFEFDDPMLEAMKAEVKARENNAKSAAIKNLPEFITVDGEAIPAAIRKETKPFVKLKI